MSIQQLTHREDTKLINCWLGKNKGKTFFKSNHYFINGYNSACGHSKIQYEDLKFIRRFEFNEIFKQKVCKKCIQICNRKGINYRT